VRLHKPQQQRGNAYLQMPGSDRQALAISKRNPLSGAAAARAPAPPYFCKNQLPDSDLLVSDVCFGGSRACTCRACRHFYCLSAPPTRLHRHACGSAACPPLPVPCMHCPSGSSLRSEDLTASGQYYADGHRPLSSFLRLRFAGTNSSRALSVINGSSGLCSTNGAGRAEDVADSMDCCECVARPVWSSCGTLGAAVTATET